MSVSTTLRIGMHGLSVHEDLLLMAMVKLLGSDNKRVSWEYVSDQPMDVVVKDGQTQLPRSASQHAPLQVSAVRQDSTGEPEGLVLHFPLRVAAVATLLKQLEHRLVDSAHLSAEPIRVTAPVIALVREAPTHAHAFAERLHREILSGPDVLELGIPGQPASLVIECWRKQFFLPAERAPVMSADAWVPLFSQLVEHCEIRRKTGTRSLHMASPAPRRTLDRLLWKLGAVAAGAQLLSWLPAEGPFQLRRWPDFGALGTQARFIKLAALMVRQPLTLDELVHAGQMSRVDLIAFINGCELCGLLRSGAAGQEKIQLARVPSRPAVPAVGMRGLLGRIRSALHLG